MSDSASISVQVLYTWSCTKRVIHPWDDAKTWSVSVEFDGSSYMVVSRKDGNCTFVNRVEDETRALRVWAKTVNLSTPRPLFPKAQTVLPGMAKDVADYDVIESSVRSGGMSWAQYL